MDLTQERWEGRVRIGRGVRSELHNTEALQRRGLLGEILCPANLSEHDESDKCRVEGEQLAHSSSSLPFSRNRSVQALVSLGSHQMEGETAKKSARSLIGTLSQGLIPAGDPPEIGNTNF